MHGFFFHLYQACVCAVHCKPDYTKTRNEGIYDHLVYLHNPCLWNCVENCGIPKVIWKKVTISGTIDTIGVLKDKRFWGSVKL